MKPERPGEFIPPQQEPTIKAHENPNYSIQGSKKDIEGRTISIGGFTSSPGYRYNETDDQWTYNGINIREDEVKDDVYNAIMEDVIKDQTERNKSSSKESSKTSTSNVIDTEKLSQNTIRNNRVDSSGSWQSEKRPRPKDFEGNFFEKQKQWREANRQWWKKFGHQQKFGKPYQEKQSRKKESISSNTNKKKEKKLWGKSGKNIFTSFIDFLKAKKTKK